MDTNKTNNELVYTDKGKLLVEDVEYVRLVSLISDLWENAKAKAAIAVNAELLDANWQTGCYIVEFEQGVSPIAQNSICKQFLHSYL